MRAFRPGALAPLVLSVSFSLAAQSGSKSAQSTPPAPAGITVTTGSQAPPPGAKKAEIEDLRVLAGKEEDDPYQFERLGVTFAQNGDLAKARDLFERSWKVGELPSAPFNLACLDVRQGRTDAAFRQLDRAVAAGFDDERMLQGDTDLAPIRGSARFSAILAGARKNLAAGDAAVVTQGTFVAPPGPARAILLLLHDASSDPLAVAGPFMSEARSAALFVAAPRGPAKAGKKRFGWGDPARATSAAERGIAEARRRAGNVPVVAVGVGRGGMIAFRLAAVRPGLLAGAGSIGGPIDAGPAGGQLSAALRNVRLFLGIPREAPPQLLQAFRQGKENLKLLGLSPAYTEWPGTGSGLPADARKPVQDILSALLGR